MLVFYPVVTASRSRFFVGSSQASSNPNHPQLRPLSLDSNIINGQTVRVFCTLQKDASPITFRWLKDGNALNSKPGHISIESHEGFSSLSIAEVDRHRDSGNYSCVASNGYGSHQVSIMLTVQGKSILACLLNSMGEHVCK